jgi:uncharacterized membrane protein (UPF0127 family)
MYYEGEIFKQFIYSQQWTHVFIMRGILTATLDIFFLADDGVFPVHKQTAESQAIQKTL